MKRVLVFDTGVGGLSVLDAIVAAKLDVELDYAADMAWLPYGLRTPDELVARVPALIDALVRDSAPDAVVIACNTASTAALAATRAVISVPVVGVVPPIKPAAAASKSGTIGLLATPSTVASAYVDDLIAQFAADKRVIRFGSSALVSAAEAKLANAAVDGTAITEAIAGLFGAPGGEAIDVVALACTHFPLMAEELSAAGPRDCLWLDSGAAIARRVGDVLSLAPGAGAPRTRRASFTDAAAGARAASAFNARGVSEFVALGSDFSPRPF